MSDHNYGFNTKALHAGQRPDPTTGARAVPIYQTTVLRLRRHRPRRHAVRVAAVRQHLHAHHEPHHGGVRGARGRARRRAWRRWPSASGQAAQFLAMISLMEAGDEMVAASTLYGGTYTQFDVSFRKLGINATFVEPDDPENFRKAITPHTKCALRRDDRQPADQRAGHRSRGEDRARARHPAGDRQHVRHTVSVPARSSTARTSCVHAPPSSWAGTAPASAASSSTAASSTGARATSPA